MHVTNIIRLSMTQQVSSPRRKALWLTAARIVVLVFMAGIVSGATGTFPYFQDFSSDPIRNGDWSVSKIGTGSDHWSHSATGGNSGGCLELTGYVGGVGLENYLDLELNTSGKTFTGGEAYSYEIYREDGRLLNGVVTVQENSSGSFLDIAGSSYLVNSLTANTWTSKSVSLPTAMGGKSSVVLRVKVTNVDVLTAFDNLRFDNASISGGALPVQLVSFTVLPSGFTAQLQWSTATEINCHGFKVEREDPGISQWKNVGFVKGAGTTSSLRRYSFNERVQASGRYKYRLTQVDNDGSMHFYQSAEVELGTAHAAPFLLGSNYPNPFNPTTTIEFTVPQNGPAALIVHDLSGQLISMLFDDNAEAGKVYAVKFDGNKLPSGLYFYRLMTGGEKFLGKALLIK
ncbi:MAG: T9SS type A sorting domain-containing protein [Ignavibacteriales bacterium]|nr:T9SS type A sorting domain-containing protein [Ignavibacteriales bacterium]